MKKVAAKKRQIRFSFQTCLYIGTCMHAADCTRNECSSAGLPDGTLICIPKITIWVYLFGRALKWKMLVYIMAIWYILWQFVIFCGNWVLFNAHLTYFVAIGHIL
jgi:hypothetical protein